jgi:hypothetical protein
MSWLTDGITTGHIVTGGGALSSSAHAAFACVRSQICFEKKFTHTHTPKKNQHVFATALYIPISFLDPKHGSLCLYSLQIQEYVSPRSRRCRFPVGNLAFAHSTTKLASKPSPYEVLPFLFFPGLPSPVVPLPTIQGGWQLQPCTAAPATQPNHRNANTNAWVIGSIPPSLRSSAELTCRQASCAEPYCKKLLHPDSGNKNHSTARNHEPCESWPCHATASASAGHHQRKYAVESLAGMLRNQKKNSCDAQWKEEKSGSTILTEISWRMAPAAPPPPWSPLLPLPTLKRWHTSLPMIWTFQIEPLSFHLFSILSFSYDPIPSALKYCTDWSSELSV